MRKNHPNSPSNPDSLRHSNSATLNAFSRVLAVLIFLILFGVAGALLDRWLETSFFILIGFLVGMVFAVVGMLYVVKVAELESRRDSLVQGGGDLERDLERGEDERFGSSG